TLSLSPITPLDHILETPSPHSPPPPPPPQPPIMGHPIYFNMFDYHREQLKEEKRINEKWLNSSDKIVNESIGLTKASSDPESSKELREPKWYLDNGCLKSMTGVKIYLYKYVEQPGPKAVFGDNSSCPTEGYGSINYGGIVFSKIAFGNGLKYNLISMS
nr:retrovirus-related Pol polyprotein from transposon TNT 1-94 [Tanacetum cinerariifolium]